jgi:hypothetical protein
MSLRRTQPISFSPLGVSDTLDGTNVFPGAMAALGNLIPDLGTPNLWAPRPASIKVVDFVAGGFTAPVGNISVFKIIGSLVFGLVSTGRNAGHDEPFCYDLSAAAFVAVSGVTNANTPLSPSFAGAWEPPTADVIGTKVVFTSPGFTVGGGVLFGWIDISNPAAPAWSGGNTTTNALPSRPSWVANFNGRAWYGVNPATGQPGAYFSDVLAATVMTNATQVLTFDDNAKLNAAAGLPLANQLGGILQSLMVFKSNNIYQITGDSALGNLAKNSLNVATGTVSQRSITTTPKGLAFNAPDGIRIIDFNARVSDPIGLYGAGVNRPFVFAAQPTRVVLTCNANVLRVSTQNTLKTGSPMEEYWYDMSRAMWSGPHTFPASMAAPYAGTFIIANQNAAGKLFQSDITLSSTSTFIENGAQMSINWTTALFPDMQNMAELELTETTINMLLDAAGSTYSLIALSSGGALLAGLLIQPPSGGTLWGNFNWGQANWASSQTGLSPQQINWPNPVIARKMQLQLTGNSFLTFRIGDCFMRTRELGYLQQNNLGV